MHHHLPEDRPTTRYMGVGLFAAVIENQDRKEIWRALMEDEEHSILYGTWDAALNRAKREAYRRWQEKNPDHPDA